MKNKKVAKKSLKKLQALIKTKVGSESLVEELLEMRKKEVKSPKYSVDNLASYTPRLKKIDPKKGYYIDNDLIEEAFKSYEKDEENYDRPFSAILKTIFNHNNGFCAHLIAAFLTKYEDKKCQKLTPNS